jgi:hypothetical protein
MEGGRDMNGHFAANRRLVLSAPAAAFAIAAFGNGGLNLWEVLEWRRSG